VAKSPAITSVKIPNLFIEHLLGNPIWTPLFPSRNPSLSIQSRNTNNEDVASNPKWVLLVTPQKGAPIALEKKKINPWEERPTTWIALLAAFV